MYLDTVYSHNHVCVGGGFWDFSWFSLECQFDDVAMSCPMILIGTLQSNCHACKDPVSKSDIVY